MAILGLMQARAAQLGILLLSRASHQRRASRRVRGRRSGMSAQRESWAKPQRESTRGIRELKYEASLKPQEPCIDCRQTCRTLSIQSYRLHYALQSRFLQWYCLRWSHRVCLGCISFLLVFFTISIPWWFLIARMNLGAWVACRCHPPRNDSTTGP